MTRRILTIPVCIAACGLIGAMVSGCQEEQASGTKKHRLIAAENARLKKELTKRESEIERLDQQHEKQSAKQQALLADCEEQKQRLEQEVKKGIEQRVSGVTTLVIDENAKQRQRIKELEAEVEGLRKQLEQGESLRAEIERLKEQIEIKARLLEKEKP